MKTKVICMGKLKEKYLKDGIAEYCKRLSRFTKLEILELVDEKTPDHASAAENEKILEKEADRILSKIAEREFVIALAIEGKQFPSETFAKAISEISFGKLTLPHQLMRLVLMEQIYRAFMIQAGSPYHK